MSFLPWMKNAQPQQAGTVLDAKMFGQLRAAGVADAEAAKLAVQPKKAGGILSGTMALGAGAAGLAVATGGGIVNWAGNKIAQWGGVAEQTQATVENLNMQTQGINWWTKILSIINAIFPTEAVTKMIDDRLQKVAEINKRLEQTKQGAYAEEKGLVGQVANGIVNNPSEALIGSTIMGLAAGKMFTGSFNPLKWFGSSNGNSNPPVPPANPSGSNGSAGLNSAAPSNGGNGTTATINNASPANAGTTHNNSSQFSTANTARNMTPDEIAKAQEAFGKPADSKFTTAHAARNMTPDEIATAKAGTASLNVEAKAHVAEPAIKAPKIEVAEAAAAGGLKGALKRNFAGAAILGGITFASNIFSGSTNAQAAEQTVKAVVPFADGFEKAAAGDVSGATKSAAVEAAGWAGFVGGTVAAAGTGAAIGAAVGSVVPVAGTVVGGFVGGAIGIGAGIASSVAASTAASYAIDGLSSLFNSEASGAQKPAPVVVPAPALQNNNPWAYALGT